MTSFSFCCQTIFEHDRPLVRNVGNHVSVEAGSDELGLWVHFKADAPDDRLVFQLGHLTDARRLLCHHRVKPYWMTPSVVTAASNVPVETQFIMAELPNDRYALFVPLLDGSFRMSLQGSQQHGLEVVAESGDPAVKTDSVCGLYLAVGDEPYSLLQGAVRSVITRLKTGRLRTEKPLPGFIDQFGWCTWDAFYKQVSHENVLRGLESFAQGGICPRLLILDGGWQAVKRTLTGAAIEARRLYSFSANEKFPGGLAPTVSIAKESFGIKTFLVWQAICGATGGIDPDGLPGYQARCQPWHYSPGAFPTEPDIDRVLGEEAVVIPPESIHRFYHDYHHELRLQNVDGVKVDFQSTLEALGAEFGGRLALAKRYREALEGSAQVHFQGNLINCMSCSNDMLYSTLCSNLARTSDDFYPTAPADIQALHIYTNAQIGLWFGEFIHPDWDMFQSDHPLGAFHAAGRALSGGPVYVSDRPEAHDFALLRKLVLPSGKILRAQLPGRPTRDCLFVDPRYEPVALKIFNRNLFTGVLGAFNCHSSENAPGIKAVIHTTDIPSLEGERFAVYSHIGQSVRVLERDDAWEVVLAPMTFEIFTVTPIQQGIAPLGMLEMFNSGGAILDAGFNRRREYEFTTHPGGKVAVWCEQGPRQVWVDDLPGVYTYDDASHLLAIDAPIGAESVHICILPQACSDNRRHKFII